MGAEKAHAKLSASGSDRWLGCPGSVDLSTRAPEGPKSNAYADEGTTAHECHEFLLKNRGSAKAVAAARKKWPSEMVDYVWQSVDFILKQVGDSELLCETKVDLSFIGAGMFGTTDAAIVELFGTLWVIDFKYGEGIVVDPKDNTQLIYYALGIAHKYGFVFDEVVLVVAQPRAEHIDGPIRWHRMSMEELRAWEQTFRDGVERTEDPLAPLEPGDWCRWCPAKTICPAISDLALRQAQVDFKPEESASMSLPVPNMLRPEHLSNILLGIKKLETWIESVQEHALFVLERGAHIPGFKLVQKRSTRKWRDGAEARGEIVYGNDAFERKFLSPAQLEKKLGDGVAIFIKKNSTNESSGVTLAPESDKRPAFSPIEADFKDESWTKAVGTSRKKEPLKLVSEAEARGKGRSKRLPTKQTTKLKTNKRKG